MKQLRCLDHMTSTMEPTEQHKVSTLLLISGFHLQSKNINTGITECLEMTVPSQSAAIQ